MKNELEAAIDLVESELKAELESARNDLNWKPKPGDVVWLFDLEQHRAWAEDRIEYYSNGLKALGALRAWRRIE